MLKNHWYVAATSRELGRKPLARRLLGEDVVLFRDGEGKAGALLDRCSHRNVPLSMGRVEDGCLACPYHGWRFDGAGRCVQIPSLCEGEGIPSSSKVPAYPVLEQQGYVWVFVGDEAPGDRLPFDLPHMGERGWTWCRIRSDVANSVANVVENFIDCPHTGYIHGGLFRNKASHRTEANVTMAADGVIIDFLEEEGKADSVLSRLLAGGREAEVRHQDRFILPGIVQVRYQFGPRRTIIGYQICTPIDEHLTRVHVHVAVALGWLTSLVRPFLPAISRFVLWQDKGVLEAQGRVIRQHGEHFCSAPADTANLWIQAVRRQAELGKAREGGREKKVAFRL